LHPSEKPLKVIFSSFRMYTATDDEIINIYPTKKSWNDFGYKTEVIIQIIIPSSNRIHTVKSSLGFLTEFGDGCSGTAYLKDELLKNDNFLIAKNYKFFTMLHDMKSYREIVSKYGIDKAKDILASLNDIVSIGEFSQDKDLYYKAIETDVFRKSFIRSSEPYYAYKNAKYILKGIETNNLGLISQNISFEFSPQGRSLSHNLNFLFDSKSELPKNIAIIIGRNGVGKSQILRNIIVSALENNGKLKDINTDGRITVNRLLAFTTSNEMVSVFPEEDDNNSNIMYRKFLLNRTVQNQDPSIADQIIQIAKSDEEIGDQTRWEIFKSAIKAIEGWEKIYLQSKHGGLKFQAQLY